jgi:hypothetical protein
MFRKTTTAVLAAASLALAGLGAAAVVPAAADAAYPICRAYAMPSYSVITQANGWNVTLTHGNDGFWYAYADDRHGHGMWSTYVAMSSYGGNPSQPFFTIYWPGGSSGRYYGQASGVTIASIFGNSFDRYNNIVQWNTYTKPVCLQY